MGWATSLPDRARARRFLPLSVVTRVFISLTLLAIWMGLAAPSAEAHATFVRSDPPPGGRLSAPGRIQAAFSEEVDPRFSELQVVDSALRRVDQRDTRLVAADAKSLSVTTPQLPDGTYTVLWKTLSAVDGHTVRGAFPLVVGDGEQSAVATTIEYTPAPAEVALRFATFLGTVLLGGLLLFTSLVFWPAVRGLRRGGAINPVIIHPLIGRWQARLRDLGLVTALTLIFVSLAWLLVQVTTAADLALLDVLGEPLTRYLETRNGQIWIGKTLLLIGYGLLLWRGPSRWHAPLGMLLAGAFMAGTSLTSHAAALARGAEFAVAIDWLHQVGAAAWLGGLIGALVLFPVALATSPQERSSVLGAIVPRLSTLAMASVFLLVGTGVTAALIQVGSRDAFASVYGGALAVKIVALLPMLVLGAIHWLFFTPRFVAAAATVVRGATPSISELTHRFRLGIGLEAALGIFILLATGVLTSAEPARDVWGRQPRPLDLTAPADDLSVNLRVEPGRVGPNTFTARILGPNGQPDPSIQRVQLRFTYLDQEFGRGSTLATPQDATTFAVTANNFSIAGRWHVEVVIRRLDREDSVADLVAAVGVPTGTEGGSAISLPSFNTPLAAAGVVLFLLALVALPWTWRTPDLPRVRRPMFAAVCLLLVFSSGAFVANSADFRPDLRSIRNPIPPSRVSLAQGERVYANQGCALCHGDTGRGDGPLATGLRPPPADFRVHMAAGHTDGELFDWVGNGVRGTAMRGFRADLSQDEIWHVINFIRSFATSEVALRDDNPQRRPGSSPPGGRS